MAKFHVLIKHSQQNKGDSHVQVSRLILHFGAKVPKHAPKQNSYNSCV